MIGHVTGILSVDEILRSEWVARVSALDLYVHELAAQRMLEIFEGLRQKTPAFEQLKIPYETMNRIRSAPSAVAASAAFDLEVRNHLSRKTFQYPDDIADAIRLFSSIELWNEVAVNMGASLATKHNAAKQLKKDLSLIINRRNKIAHEGDLQPTQPRQPWAIDASELAFVKQTIEDIVGAFEAILA